MSGGTGRAAGIALASSQSDARTTEPFPRRHPVESRRSILQQHEARLRNRLGREFRIRSEWPFVVAGNLDEDGFNRFFEYTLLDSYRSLRRDYFTSDPEDVISVYLLRNDADYRRYARELFGDEPSTPFGYYSPRHEALIMNIATGGGTLVHELCHPLIDRDFPECPSWFNEGLASLHEQCAQRDGSLVGLPNWRLPDLQKAIRADRALPLSELMAKTTHHAFYEMDKGLNYATARYLCQYVQQQGKLKEFYAEMKRNVAQDPTGRKALESVLDSQLREIEPKWREWVLTLRFP